MRCLEGALKERVVSLVAGQDLNLGAGLVPDIGNAAHEVAWLRIERLGLKPSQESLDGTVIYLGGRDPLGRAPIGEGGEPVRQALVISDGFEQWSPRRVASGVAPAEGVDNAGKLQRGTQKASQIRVALGADAVGSWTNL